MEQNSLKAFQGMAKILKYYRDKDPNINAQLLDKNAEMYCNGYPVKKIERDLEVLELVKPYLVEHLYKNADFYIQCKKDKQIVDSFILDNVETLRQSGFRI